MSIFKCACFPVRYRLERLTSYSKIPRRQVSANQWRFTYRKRVPVVFQREQLRNVAHRFNTPVGLRRDEGGGKQFYLRAQATLSDTALYRPNSWLLQV